jgi:hypothetical protein
VLGASWKASHRSKSIDLTFRASCRRLLIACCPAMSSGLPRSFRTLRCDSPMARRNKTRSETTAARLT